VAGEVVTGAEGFTLGTAPGGVHPVATRVAGACEPVCAGAFVPSDVVENATGAAVDTAAFAARAVADGSEGTAMAVVGTAALTGEYAGAANDVETSGHAVAGTGGFATTFGDTDEYGPDGARCAGGWITTAFGFAAATAAIARGFVNGMTFGGGVVASMRAGFSAIEGIVPSRRGLMSTCVRSGSNERGSRGIAVCAVP
jgi:hypothetical protein